MAPSSSRLTELNAPQHNITASIEVGGRKVEIYGVQTEGKTMYGWIESNVGDSFVLCYSVGMSNPQHDIYADATVDGSLFNDFFVRKGGWYFSASASSPARKLTFADAHISPTEHKQLVFAPLDFTSNDKLACSNDKVIDALGSIKLTVGYTNVGKDRHVNDNYHGKKIELSPVHEELRSELDITERTKLGKTSVKVADGGYYCADIEGDAGVLAEFVFLYRNKEILERKGIINNTSKSETISTYTAGSTLYEKGKAASVTESFTKERKVVSSAEEDELRFAGAGKRKKGWIKRALCL